MKTMTRKTVTSYSKHNIEMVEVADTDFMMMVLRRNTVEQMRKILCDFYRSELSKGQNMTLARKVKQRNQRVQLLLANGWTEVDYDNATK